MAVDPARQAKAAELAKGADRALAESMKLDYSRPQSGDRLLRDTVRRAYWDACQAGDHRSCWMASVVRDQGYAKPQFAPKMDSVLLEACQAGDVMTCRGLPDGARSFHHPPGARAEPVQCPEGESCATFAMRKECELGFPNSCRAGADSRMRPQDSGALEATAVRLEREGCRSGILRECRSLFDSVFGTVSDVTHGFTVENDIVQARSDFVLAGEVMCQVALDNCDRLWAAYDKTDPLKARDATERACQFQSWRSRQVKACKLLVSRYTQDTGAWPEPVPGRAKALQAWVDKHQNDKDF